MCRLCSPLDYWRPMISYRASLESVLCLRTCKIEINKHANMSILLQVVFESRTGMIWDTTVLECLMLFRYLYLGVTIALESRVSARDQHISVNVKDLNMKRQRVNGAAVTTCLLCRNDKSRNPKQCHCCLAKNMGKQV